MTNTVQTILNHNAKVYSYDSCVMVTVQGASITKMYKDYETKVEALEAALNEALEWAGIIYAPTMQEIQAVRAATGEMYGACHAALLKTRGNYGAAVGLLRQKI